MEKRVAPVGWYYVDNSSGVLLRTEESKRLDTFNSEEFCSTEEFRAMRRKIFSSRRRSRVHKRVFVLKKTNVFNGARSHSNPLISLWDSE